MPQSSTDVFRDHIFQSRPKILMAIVVKNMFENADQTLQESLNIKELLLINERASENFQTAIYKRRRTRH